MYGAAYSRNTDRAAKAYLARKAAEEKARLLVKEVPIEQESTTADPIGKANDNSAPEILTAEYRASRPTIRQIVEEVCEGTPFTYADVIGQSRKYEVAQLRHDAICAVVNRREDLSLPQIGKVFGGRDHTTILNSLKRRGIEGRRPHYKRIVEHLDVDELVRLHEQGLYYTQIAAKFGVSDTTISKLIRSHKQAA